MDPDTADRSDAADGANEADATNAADRSDAADDANARDRPESGDSSSSTIGSDPGASSKPETSSKPSVGSVSTEADDEFSVPASPVDLDSGRVTYAEFGDPAGVPVVALHGMPGSRAFGAFFEAAARERGVRVLALDRPGVGGSDPVAGRGVVDTPALVEAFLDAIDVDVAGVVGFSAGGSHALACANDIPDRITGTALLASPAPSNADVAVSTLTRVVGALARRFQTGLGLLSRFQVAMLARQDPESVVDLLTDADVADDAVYGDYTVADVLAADAALAFEQGHDALAVESTLLSTDWGFDPGTVGSTVHVFHGSDDENVPAEAADYYERILPDGRVHREPDCDHLELLLTHAGDALDAVTGD